MMLNPRQCIVDLDAYPLASSASGEYMDVLNLGNNEHWGGPSESVVAAATEAIKSVNLYPEASASKLRKALGESHDIEFDQIVCANGASELISLLCQVFCESGDEVVVAPYSYMYFRTASRISGAVVVSPEADSVTLNLDSILECVNNRTKIVFLDNPQNPIGGYIKTAALREFHRQLPAEVLLVLDAAYAEYVTAERYSSGIDLVREFDNCVMLRSFSKIYALAGMRVGWSYASRDVATLLNKARQPNNLSAISIEAAVAALNEPDVVNTRRDQNKLWRNELAAMFEQSFGFNVHQSETNFILARIPSAWKRRAKTLCYDLSAEGIVIRAMDAYGLEDYVRVTTAPPSHIARLQKKLKLIAGTFG